MAKKEIEQTKPERTSAKAIAKYLRVAPRKIRPVINEVRHKSTFKAFEILMALPQKGARLTEKVLKSAVANAKDLGLEENRLYISDIRADGGPVFKRFRPRSMGRADRILKKTSHLSLTVTQGERVFKIPGLPVVEEEAVDTKGKKKKPAKKAGEKKAKAGKA